MNDDRLFHSYLRRPNRRRLVKVVRQYQDFVWRTALQLTACRETAADISQDVFLRLLVDPPEPGDVRSATGYLRWKIIDRATRVRRTEANRRKRELRHFRETSRKALSDEDAIVIRSAIAELPNELQHTVSLRYLLGLKNSEIAESLDLSERAVEERLKRGREILRGKLGECFGALALLATAAGAQAASIPDELTRELLRICNAGSALTGVVAGSAETAGRRSKVFLALLGSVALGTSFGVWAWNSNERVSETHLAHVVAEPRRGRSPVELKSSERQETTAEKVSFRDASAAAAPPRAALRGRVLDELGQPVRDARVSLDAEVDEGRAEELRALGYSTVSTGEVHHECFSNEQGEYAFADLLPISAWLSVEKPPLRQCRVKKPRIEAGDDNIANVELCFARRVHGAVLDELGDAVPNARVLVSRETGGMPVEGAAEFFRLRQSLEADELEWRSIRADHLGQYDSGITLVFPPEEASLQRMKLWAVGDRFAAVSRVLTAEHFLNLTAELDFVLPPETPHRIQVVDGSGAPVPDVEVRIVEEKSPFHTTRTRGDGTVELENLSADRLRVRFSKEGFRSQIAEVEASTSTHVVTLSAPLPAIEGRLVFDEKIPTERLVFGTIALEKEVQKGGFLPTFPKTQLDRESFSFHFWPENPGRYRVRRDEGFHAAVTDTIDYSGAGRVEVKLRVDRRPPFVTGNVVRGSSGEAVAGVPVELHVVSHEERHHSGWQFFTVLQGFRFPSLPGNHVVTKTNEKGRFLLFLPRKENGHSDARRSGIATIRVGSAEQGWAEDLVFDWDEETTAHCEAEIPAGGMIEGRVFQGGSPVVGEMVVAHDGRGHVVSTQTNGQGHYRLERLPAGQYAVLPLTADLDIPRGGGSAALGVGIPPPVEFFELPVSVSEGQATRWDLDIDADRLGSLTCTIAAEVRPGMFVDFGHVFAGEPRRVGPLGYRMPIQSKRISFNSVLPGNYSVRLLHKTSVLDEKAIEVFPNRVSRCVLKKRCAQRRQRFWSSTEPTPRHSIDERI